MRKHLLALLAAAPLALAAASANAADLPSRYAPPTPFVSVPVFTWTGFYVGVNAGYGWNANNNATVLVPGGGYASSGSGSNGGFVGGGQIGYNYQFTPGTGLVIGVEGDLQYADLGGNNGYPYSSGSNGNYFGTVRARLGYAFDRFLVYATGGFAYGDVGNNSGYPYVASTTVPAYYGSNGNGSSGGWTLGGGVEYAFTNNLSAKVEGLYVSLGRNGGTAYAAAPYYSVATGTNRNEFGVVRAGLNYKFTTY